ncbi:MAG TPA: TrkH family potassium uptake protein [Candidatus Pelagibacter bacterium]|nr:TrkH family potassium uptake protein [Candidatus Pelagibacter bacterium]|tara:strand:+ start:16024 stop:17433 length:1410 start_codon:yes stop_codon:yes gene_type:complete
MSRFSLIYLCIFSFVISILSFFNIIYSNYFNLYLNIDSYVYSLIISFLFSLIFLLIKKNQEYKISIYEKIITVFLGYIILPFFIAIPYYFSIFNITFINAYFEAVSGFTSTGFSIFENIKHLDESLILWRSTSQWIGGLYFLFSIILLIDIFDVNLKKPLTTLLSFNTSETLKQSAKIFILYTFLTFGIFLILNIFNIRSFNSFNLAMTIISSGGFLPTNSLDIILNSKTKAIVLSFLMLVSFFSLFLSYNLFTFKKKNLSFFQEDFYLLIYLCIVVLLFFFLFNNSNSFGETFLSIISSISNIGISLKGSYQNSSFIFLILTIIGGSFFSTSSGIRVVKIYSLFKFSINELASHAKPLNVYVNKLEFSGSKLETIDINKYFISVLIFIFSLLMLSSLLTISGIDLESAFKLAILTLMNTVNSSIHGLNDFNFNELQYFTKYFLVIFMIIGRVELLTLLIILKKFLFKN